MCSVPYYVQHMRSLCALCVLCNMGCMHALALCLVLFKHRFCVQHAMASRAVDSLQDGRAPELQAIEGH